MSWKSSPWSASARGLSEAATIATCVPGASVTGRASSRHRSHRDAATDQLIAVCFRQQIESHRHGHVGRPSLNSRPATQRNQNRRSRGKQRHVLDEIEERLLPQAYCRRMATLPDRRSSPIRRRWHATRIAALPADR